MKKKTNKMNTEFILNDINYVSIIFESADKLLCYL